MARANKILSNIVGLAAAREACQGYLQGEAGADGAIIPSDFDGSWKKYEPNTYADTGATITTTAPNPINPTRQRRKGVVTDLEASIGFNHDLSASNMKDMFEAALFSNIVPAMGGGVSVQNKVGYPTTGLSFPISNIIDSADATGNFSELVISGAKELTSFAVGGYIVLSGLTDENAKFNKAYYISSIDDISSRIIGISNVAATDVAGTLPEFPVDGNGALSDLSGVSIKMATRETSSPIATDSHELIAPSAGYINMDVDANGVKSLISAGTDVDFTTLELKAGDWIFVGGDDINGIITSFANIANNGFKRVAALRDANGVPTDNPTPTTLVFDKGNGNEVTENTSAGTGNTNRCIKLFLGDTLKNGAVRPANTFQFERLLGHSEGGEGNNQSELITGCVLNEVSVNFPASGLVNVDLGFVAKDQILLSDGDENKSDGASDDLLRGDIFNTTSDISRMKLSRVDADGSIIQGDGFFNFVTEASLTINNGVTPDKALSVLGSFDYSTGNFIVSGSLQAYFANVDAVRAVRENADVTLDYALVKENAGVLFDLPLITLGDGRLNVEEGQSISLPLNTEAATAAKHGLDYTLKIVFFPHLPNLADEM